MAKKRARNKARAVVHKTIRKMARKKAGKKPAPAKLWTCHDCLEKYDSKTNHDCEPRTERELIAVLDEDLQDAFFKLRELATGFGEQRVYNNARAVMFARRVCYMFVRPKRTYLELCFFLPRKENDTAIHRASAVSKSKFAHTLELVHGDQIEAPLVEWLQEAFAGSG